MLRKRLRSAYKEVISLPFDALDRIERKLKRIESMFPSAAPEWKPQPGPQTLAYYSEADDLLYGGQPGGG
jgi:hypothetical protein